MQDKIPPASNEIHSRSISLSYVLTQSQRWATQKTWMASLATSLGLAGGLWFTVEAKIPQIVQAETASVNLHIERRQGEKYESLQNRAQEAAKQAVEATLAENRKATDVSITVIGQHQGAIAPILSLDVSRAQWSSPDANRWITQFNQARSLLRFDEDLATTTPAGTSTTTPRPGVQPRNTNPTSRLQQRNTNPTSSRQQQNSGPGSIQKAVDGSFTQPGNVATPPTSGQPTNNIPSQSGTQPTSTSGTGLTPQAPVTTPVNSTTQPQNSSTSGTTTQPSVTAPVNSTSQPSSSSPAPGTGMTPQPPVAAPVSSPNLTPQNNASPSNQTSSPATTGTSTTPINTTTTPNTPGIIP
jgi:hypothetical protein